MKEKQYRFKHKLSCKSTIKKKKGYDLHDITLEDLNKAKESTFENPYIKKGKEGLFEMFYDTISKQITIHWYISFEGFQYTGEAGEVCSQSSEEGKE